MATLYCDSGQCWTATDGLLQPVPRQADSDALCSLGFSEVPEWSCDDLPDAQRWRGSASENSSTLLRSTFPSQLDAKTAGQVRNAQSQSSWHHGASMISSTDNNSSLYPMHGEPSRVANMVTQPIWQIVPEEKEYAFMPEEMMLHHETSILSLPTNVALICQPVGFATDATGPRAAPCTFSHPHRAGIPAVVVGVHVTAFREYPDEAQFSSKPNGTNTQMQAMPFQLVPVAGDLQQDAQQILSEYGWNDSPNDNTLHDHGQPQGLREEDHWSEADFCDMAISQPLLVSPTQDYHISELPSGSTVSVSDVATETESPTSQVSKFPIAVPDSRKITLCDKGRFVVREEACEDCRELKVRCVHGDNMDITRGRNHHISVRKEACDDCRERKVRCDHGDNTETLIKRSTGRYWRKGDSQRLLELLEEGRTLQEASEHFSERGERGCLRRCKYLVKRPPPWLSEDCRVRLRQRLLSSRKADPHTTKATSPGVKRAFATDTTAYRPTRPAAISNPAQVGPGP